LTNPTLNGSPNVTFTTARNISITNSGTLATATGTTAIYNGAISNATNAAALTIGDNTGNENGSATNGTVILNGANTYSGSTTLLAGILEVSQDGNLGAPSSSVNVAALSLGGEFLTNPTLSGAQNVTFMTARTFGFANGQSETLAAFTGTTAIYTGRIFVDTVLVIGDTTGNANGTVVLNGASMQFDVGLSVGIVTTSGTLVVANGSQISAAFEQIGQGGASTVTVTGANASGTPSTWNNGSGTLVLGNHGAGTLNIENGGLVQTGVLTLSSNSTDSGTLNIGNGTLAGTLLATEVTSGLGTAQVNFAETDASYSFAPALTGSLSVSQTGSGATVLSGTNTYTGATSVSSGTLVVSGSISGTSHVNVTGGTNPAIITVNGSLTTAGGVTLGMNGVLGGSGTINGAVTANTGSTVAPNASAAGLTINSGAVDLNSGSTLLLSIANSNASSGGAPSLGDYSKLTLGTGVVATVGGNIQINVVGTVNYLDLFTVILSGTPVSGTFGNTTLVPGTDAYAFTSGGTQFEINYGFNSSTFSGTLSSFENNTGGNEVALLVVPEPSSWSMLAASLAFSMGLQRFRRRRG
jgi:autotransporter-associated beta strand protein/T5SS/PEP-CTERM-associated repeat protein